MKINYYLLYFNIIFSYNKKISFWNYILFNESYTRRTRENRL